MRFNFVLSAFPFCPAFFFKGRPLGTRLIEKMKFQVLNLHQSVLGDCGYVCFFHRGSVIVTIKIAFTANGYLHWDSVAFGVMKYFW